VNKVSLAEIPIKPGNSEQCKTEVACENCGLYGMLGVLSKLEHKNPKDMEKILKRRQQVAKGENLYRAGQPFYAMYAVKSGSFKSYSFLEDGQEQVVRFHFPGELLGLEAVSSSSYQYSARALENSSICELRLEDLGLIQGHFHQFQEQLIHILSRQVHREQQQRVLSARQTAEERIAAFLIDLSRRLAERQLAATEFRLAMSRLDIANNLGLSVETVGRTFKLFQTRGLLKLNGKRIQLINKADLEKLAQLS